MTSIIEKRLCLHRDLADQHQQNDALKAHIRQLQNLANMGTASCMIAHEINNLLTPLANYAALAIQNPGDKSLADKALRKTLQNCQHATKMMESMLAMVNGHRQEKENVPLAELVEEVFACLGRDFARDGITVKIQVPENLTVWAVPVQIQHVLMNLILNARHAMLPRGGILTIRAKDSAEVTHIEVADTGSGIEPADLPRIFESFFTTKRLEGRGAMDDGRGTGCGLGLAFCKQVVDAHDGCISVESEPGQGSTFKITLPRPQ